MKANSKTHWKKLHNPNYLGAYSLNEGKDMVLTIKTVVLETVKTDRGSEECTVIHFVEKQKPMILNATNSKQIAKLYDTPYIEEWVGKQIQLYAAKIRAFGEDMEALRIRPAIPKSKKTELTPAHPRWNAALNAMQQGNTTLADILKNYEVSEVNQKTLLSDEKNAA